MKMLVFLIILASTACSNAPVKQPDVCYGMQGWALDDCILRHRGFPERR